MHSPLHFPAKVQKNLHEVNSAMQIFPFLNADFSLFYPFDNFLTKSS